MTSLLLHNAVVHTGVGGDVVPSALVIRDGQVVAIGSADSLASYPVDRRFDCRGDLVAPAFVDAHVHVVQTGFLLTYLDLSGARSLQHALDLLAVHARASAPDEVLIGTGWDESTWPERRAPTALELAAAAPQRQVMLMRLDAHSAVLSPELMIQISGLAEQPGYDPQGHMTLDAMAHTTNAMGTLVGPRMRGAAAAAAMDAFAAHGIAAFHENGAAHVGPDYEIGLIREAADEAGLHATMYWGEHATEEGAIERARALGVRGLAGDLNADGSIGSRTAAMHTAYQDRPGHTGHTYLSAQEMADHIVACTLAGLQGGFHCIGEVGLEAVTEAFRIAEQRLGAPMIRAAGHRLEHLEMPTTETAPMLADLGVHASMQPMFDRLWGGPDKMYAERLGDRWRGMNPIGTFHQAGVNVALGSDTPVSQIDPWVAISAACSHHEPEYSVDRETAFAMHTRGGWLARGPQREAPTEAGGEEAADFSRAGLIEPGAPAFLARWSGELEGTLPILESHPELQMLIVNDRMVVEVEE